MKAFFLKSIKLFASLVLFSLSELEWLILRHYEVLTKPNSLVCSLVRQLVLPRGKKYPRRPRPPSLSISVISQDRVSFADWLRKCWLCPVGNSDHRSCLSAAQRTGSKPLLHWVKSMKEDVPNPRKALMVDMRVGQ